VSPPTNSEYPIFGEIVRIFVPNDTKQLLLRSYDTETYSAHFNAYQVTQNNQYSIISVSQLGIHEVYHRYIVSPHSYVLKSYHHVEFDI
jgi:hypothetical protein